MEKQLETATLGAGCFWCVDAVFRELAGVKQVASGYAGGKVENPTYQQVCSGRTGHAEVIQITYDPGAISYAELLYVFWRIHDPTTLNRQGADVGAQYRSVIFTHDEAQWKIAHQSKREAEASGLWPNPLVTEISPYQGFYEAESYHQDYFRQNPNQLYCRMVIDPKIRKFRASFQGKLKSAAISSQT